MQRTPFCPPRIRRNPIAAAAQFAYAGMARPLLASGTAFHCFPSVRFSTQEFP